MIETIMHLFGFCGDHHQHINIIMILNEFLNTNFCWCYIKNKALNLFYYNEDNKSKI
jgi:hypothetical protein